MPEVAPIVGQPVAYGMALAMLVLYVFAAYIGRYPLVLAHEGIHMLGLILFLRPIEFWTIDDDRSGLTKFAVPLKWAPSNVIVWFTGYIGPPLLGLGGAALVADGNAWGVLILTLVLCILALVPARKGGLAFLIPLLVVLGVGATMIGGSPDVRAAVVAGIVWYLLLGGVVRIFHVFGAKSGDAVALRRSTLVPRVVWELLWVVIGIVCLVRGGAMLLARP